MSSSTLFCLMRVETQVPCSVAAGLPRRPLARSQLNQEFLDRGLGANKFRMNDVDEHVRMLAVGSRIPWPFCQPLASGYRSLTVGSATMSHSRRGFSACRICSLLAAICVADAKPGKRRFRASDNSFRSGTRRGEGALFKEGRTTRLYSVVSMRPRSASSVCQSSAS